MYNYPLNRFVLSGRTPNILWWKGKRDEFSVLISPWTHTSWLIIVKFSVSFQIALHVYLLLTCFTASPLPSQLVDCDNLLTNPNVLWKLIQENKTIIAPMLESRAAYSNFWCGMTSEVLQRPVPRCLLHVLTNALNSFTNLCTNSLLFDRVITGGPLLTYPSGGRCERAVLLFQWFTRHFWSTSGKKHQSSSPFILHIQIIAGLLMTSLFLRILLGWQVLNLYFLLLVIIKSVEIFYSCNLHLNHLLLLSDVQMFVCNRESYGYFPVPLRSHNTLQDEADSFLHALLEVNGELFATNFLFFLWHCIFFCFIVLSFEHFLHGFVI